MPKPPAGFGPCLADFMKPSRIKKKADEKGRQALGGGGARFLLRNAPIEVPFSSPAPRTWRRCPDAFGSQPLRTR